MSKRLCLGLIRNPAAAAIPSFHPVYDDLPPQCVECGRGIPAGRSGRSCVDCRRLAEPVDAAWLDMIGGVCQPDNSYMVGDLLVWGSGNKWVAGLGPEAIHTATKRDVLNLIQLQQALRKANEQHQELQAESVEPGLQVDEEPVGASAGEA